MNINENVSILSYLIHEFINQKHVTLFTLFRIGGSDSYYEDILSKVNGYAVFYYFFNISLLRTHDRFLIAIFFRVLWPGGSTCFSQKKGYADAGATIYRSLQNKKECNALNSNYSNYILHLHFLFVNRIAKEINARGVYFPIFGICLGFELLTYVAANRVEHRTLCSSMNQPLPLEFTHGKCFFQDQKHIVLFSRIFLLPVYFFIFA